MTELINILDKFRTVSRTEREKGTYFEELIRCYLSNEPCYRDLYGDDVWTYGDWARTQGKSAQDTGIDLVARTRSGDLHAVQCKLYDSDYCLQKSDIDSFFTASGKKAFSHRIIVSTTNRWSRHANEALIDQQPPVTRLDLRDLEESQIDWGSYAPSAPVKFKPRKALRPHQESALRAVEAGLKSADRGKLIMACGTGKTFAALKIAEAIAGQESTVLFLVPSLALVSQTLTEWTQESGVPLHSFAVCSDTKIGKKKAANEDLVQLLVHELRYPATTDAKALSLEFEKRHDASHMSVVFSTYHSIEVLSQAQKEHGFPAFDLIICDEAHRTTGAVYAGEDESNFVKVHDAGFLKGRKRLYMTATPRIYANSAKATAERDSITLCSMDDPELYGEQLYLLTFSNAVTQGLLVDYKVVVLAVQETHVSRRLQRLLADHDNQLRVDDAAKIVGCWKALAKQGLTEDLPGDPEPMKRAVAFCQVIEPTSEAKVHKVSSKNIAAMFQAVVEAYQEKDDVEQETRLRCEVEHVDGTMNASVKEEKLQWLKAEPSADTCRILSNVRCLSEGVDVPALDAVLFLTPRKSQVDVVQSVGRVMRNAPGKKRGYVIIPVVIPAGVEAHEALNDNKTYAVVWQVLQALRSHDDRFDAMVNKMDLELNRRMLSKMEVVAVRDKILPKRKKRNGSAAALRSAKGGGIIGSPASSARESGAQYTLPFEIGELERAIYAKVVQKCGNRHHWEDWAKDIAQIARTHIDRIAGILENEENTSERESFERFAEELRDDLNDSITRDEIIEMLAQHLVTRPVFDALFAGHSFAAQNSISRAMQQVLDALHEHRLDKETETLEKFYQSVKLRAQGIESAEAKQKIVAELYDKFFRHAFPKMSERLGIVYTPVEIVDFIIRSVDHLLRSEFGQTLGSEGVHILDPFAGTGTFITRLMQAGLISREELPRKYGKEIHANEIVLLAYYIAAINIETTYHGLIGGKFHPFEGICLTDTFQLYEKDDLISRVLVDNSKRRMRQKNLDIRVIIGNPPYSVGQASQNDNNQNVDYPRLDSRIAETYAARSTAVLKNALYDSYVRAIRWASDRVGKQGIIGFVTNASFVDGTTAAGLRKCVAEEFSRLYIFHLRGNQRTVGELSRKEGGKIFGSGSRAPVAISLLVKNQDAKEHGLIQFRDVGDYLTREQKLEAISTFGSVAGVAEANGWTALTPDEHGDWLRQRDPDFERFIVLGDKANPRATSLFELYSNGVKTQRDAWTYGPSANAVKENIKRMIRFYNAEVERFEKAHSGLGKKQRRPLVDAFIDRDQTKISWSRALKNDLANATQLDFDPTKMVPSLYRPFAKQWLYFDRKLNEIVGQVPRLFPSTSVENRVIMVKQRWSGNGNLALMVDVIPELQIDGGAQNFPLYTYDDADSGNSGELFARRSAEAGRKARRDGISDAGLKHFQTAYAGEQISKEDIFYYVYGILHSPDYRERYANNLIKDLPRIPRVRTAADFWAFTRAGGALGDLHVGYERVPEYAARIEGPANPTKSELRVKRMRFGKGKDKSTIHYNELITVRDIPLEAYDYVVNGRPAVEWVMDRQRVTTDKASGILKDANSWATETVGDPRYPLSLLLRVITVSIETMQIVRSLPDLDLLE